MEVYILTQYNPDEEQDVIVKVFNEVWKSTEYVYCFSSKHYGHYGYDGVYIVENQDHITYTVRTKDDEILFYCDKYEVE